MKKIFTLTALLVGLSMATFAAERPTPASKISITSQSYTDVQVKIDGVKYSLDRFGSVMSNIAPGYHQVVITKMQNRGMFRWNRNDVVFQSSLFVDPAQLVNICIERAGNVTINKSSLGFTGRDNHFGDRKDIDYGHDFKGRDHDDHFGRH